MNVEYINPFLTAVASVLEQYGVTDIRKGNISIKEAMVVERDVCAFIGIIGQLRGNIAYSFPQQTARRFASAFLMGMEVTEWDELSRSVLSEFANMFTGNATPLFESQGIIVDITPPTVVMGEELYLVLSNIKTFYIELETSLGKLEISISLEI